MCAQIASYVDEHGKRVFINDAGAATRRSSNRTGLSTFGSRWAGAFGAGFGQMWGYRSSSPNPRTPPQVLDRLVNETAERHRVDPALVRAVIETESNWNPTAVSRKGAVGLMQLVPGTAQRVGVRNVLNPRQNLEGGVRYLRMLLERYNGNLEKALAAYNAGEGAVDRFGGVPNFRETRDYVRKVTDSYFRPDSGRQPTVWDVPRPIRRETDERGRVVFTNE